MMENGTFLNVILIILSVAVLLFVAFAVPFLLQIWQTAKGLSQALQVFNESLPSIMKNLEEITTKVNRTTTTVSRQVEDFSLLAEKIRGTLTLVVGLEEIVRRGLMGVRLPYGSAFRTGFAVAKGVRVFMTYLLSDRPVNGCSERKR
ncbi:MAG: DUF948 domain-containing protein [Deltaproteobacteria bacterium]|nr:DUF948 domain-containing protein [Deltaproteobacteria bacterium]